MTKADFIASVAEKAGLSKKDAAAAIAAVTASIAEAVAEGEKVSLVGFGTFEVSERAERLGRNPRTNEQVTIPASKSVKFKAGKALKDAVNK